jgi:hypothetical protein
LDTPAIARFYRVIGSPLRTQPFYGELHLNHISNEIKLKTMKTKKIKLHPFSLLLLPLCVVMLGAGCEKEEDKLQPLKDKVLTIVEMNSNGCKESLKSNEIEQYIELKAEGEDHLRLIFINATINCAGLDTAFASIQDTILKVSFIEDPSADCVCNYDLECVINSMEKRKYNVEVYVNSDEPKANFEFTYSSKLNSKISITDN